LAFQGGGAKGVAYVGAYSAIKEMKRYENSVPITSIMGSSAGGIIALAVSTNIDPYEVQKICYKMGTIPKNDRIDRKYLRSLGEKYSTNDKIDKEA
jgi:predicted acylesterase/phospholipase RssA